MNLTIIGAGYVGLVTAAVFSNLGNRVFCVDTNKERIDSLKKGKMPFFEPQLAEYVSRNLKDRRLIFTTSYQTSVPKSQIALICVGTPPRNNGEADLSYLFSAVEEVAKNIKSYALITIKSTIPIGFEDDLEALAKKHAKGEFEFASSPEFLREGTALEDTLHPDRIVIGTESKKAKDLLLALHTPISGERIITDIRSAQLIKYSSNAYLATKISFANSISILCEKMGADVSKVLHAVGADKRIGHSFLRPGVGYGGSCLPKDVLAFIAQAQKFDYNFDLLMEVDSINRGQIERFITKIRKILNAQEGIKNNLQGVSIAILGLAFKPDTDDLREAPSIKIIPKLLDLKAQITAYDPQAMDNSKKIFPKIKYAKSVYDAIKDKDVLIILTEWQQFTEIDLKRAKKIMKKAIIVDGRNIFNPNIVKQAGFKYVGVGQ